MELTPREPKSEVAIKAREVYLTFARRVIGESNLDYSTLYRRFAQNDWAAIKLDDAIAEAIVRGGYSLKSAENVYQLCDQNLHRAIKELDSMLLFVSKKTASERLNLSGSTLKKYRLKGDWIEGIHWVRLNSRCIRYNLELIQDWLHNRQNPKAHMRAIETYQKSLLSNQRKTRH